MVTVIKMEKLFHFILKIKIGDIVMYKLFITENDLKQESHFPMMALFNLLQFGEIGEYKLIEKSSTKS